jgi:heptosyltransferase-2
VNGRDKVLIVGPSWVGDMVMAQALYRWLLERAPTLELHVLAPTWSKPVLARMPEVTTAIEQPTGHGELAWRKRRDLGVRLRAVGYQRAIVLPRSLKSALIPFFARIPVRTGYRGEWRYGLINDMRAMRTRRDDQTVRRFLDLGAAADEPPIAPAPEPRLQLDPFNLAALRARHGLAAADAAVVALMPGAEFGPAKRWPLERYAELARRLARGGVEVWVLGSEKEAELGATIASGHAAIRDLCGKTSLADAIDLLGGARVAVTNDSGLMHIAAAVDCHVVAIYGSSSPAFTPPLTSRKDIIYLGLECSPCFERHCPLKHLRCLNDISADRVWHSVTAALDASR